jgi:hypothetical protein
MTRPQARRRSFDLMDAIAICLWLIGAAAVAGAVWFAFAFLTSLAAYVPAGLR